MRPRHVAAENRSRVGALTLSMRCFNEAAACSRGKRYRRTRSRPISASFNEAAACSRGKHGEIGILTAKQGGFNEAAACSRGKQKAPLADQYMFYALQ